MKSGACRGILAVVIVSIYLVGCGNLSRMSMAGTYVNEQDQKDFIELKSNGSYYVHENGMGMAGSYEVDGDQITLKTDMGFASRGKIAGKTLIDDDGARWTKQ